MKKVNEYEKSLKKLQKFKYGFWKKLVTILLFPIIYPLSWIVTSCFTPYLFKYPRNGVDKKGVEVNTLTQLKAVIKQKKLVDIDIEQKQITELNIEDEGGKISCVWLKNNSKRWIVALHGFKRNKYIGLRNAIHFFKKGYNIISFDAYAHGNTYGTYSDLGVTNSKLLNKVILWIKQNQKVEEIGVIGVSMGAASAVYWAQQFYIKNKIDWLISDCALTQPVEQIRHFLNHYFKLIPWWLVSFNINDRFKKISKTDLKEMNLQQNLSHINELPILFIHGTKDSFISYHNAIVMYQLQSKNNTKSKLKLFAKAEHSTSIIDYQKEYEQLTIDFVNDALK